MSKRARRIARGDKRCAEKGARVAAGSGEGDSFSRGPDAATVKTTSRSDIKNCTEISKRNVNVRISLHAGTG
ncbi:MAG: hypothetical protein ABI231_05390, partial [Candidatus Tumulicola sp.]